MASSGRRIDWILYCPVSGDVIHVCVRVAGQFGCCEERLLLSSVPAPSFRCQRQRHDQETRMNNGQLQHHGDVTPLWSCVVIVTVSCGHAFRMK